jgi:hypothetical protein
MPSSYHPHERNVPSYSKLTKSVHVKIPGAPDMKSASNKPYEVGFAEQLDSLIYYHLENHESGRHHLQVLQEDSFAKKYIAPKKGMKRSTFFELNNSRGLEQMSYMFNELQIEASEMVLPQYQNLGKLVAVDGSLLDAVLSMYWADYRKGAKKAKVHLGFDINQGIPQKIFLTNGKKGERSFVEKIIAPGQTGVLDRGYQCHRNFDQWQESGRHFACRIRANTHKTVIRQIPLPEDSIVFYDAMVLLGKPQTNQTQKPLRLVGYEVLGTEYWIATDRLDLSPDDIALIYKLRWDIEKFFKWWKRHLNVYHILFRSKYGLLIQILAGLITYLLLAMYCQEQFGERVSIKRFRELRIQIHNEIIAAGGPPIFLQQSGP